MYPFSFIAVIYRAFNEDKSQSEYYLESGMGFAESYVEAMQQIDNYYESDLIAVKHLELHEENDLILLPIQTIENFRKAEQGMDYHWTEVPCDFNGFPLPEVKKESAENV